MALSDVECGKRLRECREKAGYKQRELADAVYALEANRGKERASNQIGYMERGQRKISYEYAALLSQVLGVRADYLLGKDDYKTEEDYKAAHYLHEEYEIRKEEMDWWAREFKVTQILKMMGYYLTTKPEQNASEIYGENIDCEEASRKLRALFYDGNIDGDMVLNQFSKKELEMFICEMHELGVDHNDYDESHRDYISKHYDELLNNAIKSSQEWSEEKAGLIYNERYYICNRDGDIITEFSGKKYEEFVNEIYNVINALIKYHITDRED